MKHYCGIRVSSTVIFIGFAMSTSCQASELLCTVLKDGQVYRKEQAPLSSSGYAEIGMINALPLTTPGGTFTVQADTYQGKLLNMSISDAYGNQVTDPGSTQPGYDPDHGSARVMSLRSEPAYQAVCSISEEKRIFEGPKFGGALPAPKSDTSGSDASGAQALN